MIVSVSSDLLNLYFTLLLVEFGANRKASVVYQTTVDDETSYVNLARKAVDFEWLLTYKQSEADVLRTLVGRTLNKLVLVQEGRVFWRVSASPANERNSLRNVILLRCENKDSCDGVSASPFQNLHFQAVSSLQSSRGSRRSCIRRKLQNSIPPFHSRTDEQVVVVSAANFEAMKSLNKKKSRLVRIKKKKKRSRRKKTSTKITAMSVGGEGSQLSNPALNSNMIAPEPTSSKESSSGAPVAVSYRDVLANQDAEVLSAGEDSNEKEILKNIRREVSTPYGKWINEGWLDARATQGTRIKVLSYNILGQKLLEGHQYLYLDHDKRFLTWEYRSRALIQEFADFDADILCLQEVEESKLSFFDAALALRGYSKGVYKKRTRYNQDGCAIYYRKSKFELKEVVRIEYFQPNVSVLDRDNVGLIVRLVPTDAPDKTIVVATTHLLFNPRRQDVKLAQMQLMLAEIERVAFKNTIKGRDTYHPIILTGDFNSRPFRPVYNLVMNGRIHLDGLCPIPPHLGISSLCQHQEVIRNRGQQCREESDIRHVQLHNTERTDPPPRPPPRQELPWRRRDESNYVSHRLNLNSVYWHHPRRPEDASTFHDCWCTVDYIFYGPTKFALDERVDGDMKLVSYLRLPSPKEAENLKRIPSEACASDHFPLLATFHLPTGV